MRNFFLIALLMLAAPAAAATAGTAVSGMTIVRMEERSSPGFSETVIPATQFLTLSTADGNLSVHLSGWGRLDLADASTRDGRSDGDLTYGYLQYRLPTANGRLKLGRLFVYEGVAAEQLDGIGAGTDLAAGFSLSLFGGVPTRPDYGGSRRGDYIVGGRLAWRMAGRLEAGISGLTEGGTIDPSTGSGDDRRLVGGDFWFSPHAAIDLAGRTVYSASTGGVADQNYVITARPASSVSVTAEHSEQRLADLFAFSTLPSLFGTGGDDRVVSTGGGVTFAIAGPAEATVDYRHLRRDRRGDADRYGADLRLTLPERKLRGGVSYHRLDAAAAVNSYHELRAYLLNTSGNYQGSIDAISHRYDTAINGRRSAWELTGSVGRRFGSLSLSGDLAFGRNPGYDSEVRGLVRLVFNLTSAQGAVR